MFKKFKELFRKLFSKDEKIGEYIAFYKLTNWWLTEFTEKERYLIVKMYDRLAEEYASRIIDVTGSIVTEEEKNSMTLILEELVKEVDSM